MECEIVSTYTYQLSGRGGHAFYSTAVPVPPVARQLKVYKQLFILVEVFGFVTLLLWELAMDGVGRSCLAGEGLWRAHKGPGQSIVEEVVQKHTFCFVTA